MPSDAILEVSDLRGGYDATPVLHGIDLEVPQGSTVALLGRNGMGKSSTIKAIMGILPRRSGSVRLRGVEISGLDSAARARAGLGYVPESRQVFRSLTVREHLEIAARPGIDGTAAWSPARLMDLFPVLGRLRMMRSWGGIVDTCADASPIVSKTPIEGLYVNCGWGTGGFKATPGSGWVFAHTIAQDRPHPLNAPFALDRFTSGALIDEHGAAAVAH